jgi:hypothetical protein
MRLSYALLPAASNQNGFHANPSDHKIGRVGIRALCFLLGAVEIIYKNGFWGLLLIAIGVFCLVAGQTT